MQTLNGPTNPPPTAVPNKMCFADMIEVAKMLGEQKGKGADTQVKFLLKAVEAGYHGAADTAPNKHSAEVDDATKLAEAYVMAQGTATVFDSKAPNQRKLASTIRTSIRLGMWPKGGNGEPLATVNNLMTIRQKLRNGPERKQLDDAANTLMRYARAQLKRDQLIDGDELRSFCMKPDVEQATAEEVVERIRNQLTKLLNGEASNGTAQDVSAEVKQAQQLLTKRLVDIANAKPKNSAPIKKVA